VGESHVAYQGSGVRFQIIFDFIWFLIPWPPTSGPWPLNAFILGTSMSKIPIWIVKDSKVQSFLCIQLGWFRLNFPCRDLRRLFITRLLWVIFPHY